MRTFKRAVIFVAVIFAVYLAVGYFLHLVVFPENKPDISSYFEEGHTFYSIEEGVLQTVVSQEDGFVNVNLEVHPHAAGPPKHIHYTFDEYFEIENGQLTLWVDGKIRRIGPGEVVHVPKGMPHKLYNETNDTIRLSKAFAMPENFAFYLTQVYGIMDHSPDFGKMPSTMFMMAPIQQAGFDSHLAEGLQRVMSFLLTPLARLMGYRSYYEQYDVHALHNH